MTTDFDFRQETGGCATGNHLSNRHQQYDPGHQAGAIILEIIWGGFTIRQASAKHGDA
tara:strand:- start:5217 stop:5390 length:174 start_codon:yes stop_codon:yes gene_type:complete